MRKWLVALLAVTAALMPSLALAQVSSDSGTSNKSTGPAYKYQVFAGAGYIGLNQVNQSRYGLIGANVAVSRNWGRYFAVTIDGAYYPSSLGSGNPGDPSVDAILGGPELHGQLFERWELFVRGLIGYEHTGGEHMIPDTSFAGGGGGGVEYSINSRWGVRVSGDVIGASFSPENNTPLLGYSPHRTFNSRASGGIVYRF
ncbi:MAG TPA: hypothetical protein VKB38_24830 [Terracidiphilus sp.]|nr:hypothetical protein [Terracidiphilus sp.]